MGGRLNIQTNLVVRGLNLSRLSNKFAEHFFFRGIQSFLTCGCRVSINSCTSVRHEPAGNQRLDRFFPTSDRYQWIINPEFKDRPLILSQIRLRCFHALPNRFRLFSRFVAHRRFSRLLSKLFPFQWSAIQQSLVGAGPSLRFSISM